jgi:hypothetical protein
MNSQLYWWLVLIVHLAMTMGYELTTLLVIGTDCTPRHDNGVWTHNFIGDRTTIFTTTCAISTYHQWSCEFIPCCHGEVYNQYLSPIKLWVHTPLSWRGVQSVPITNKVVSSNPVHGEVYNRCLSPHSNQHILPSYLVVSQLWGFIDINFVIVWLGLRWWFNATFNNIWVISWRWFYWWRKPENPAQLYHIM